MTRRVLHVVSHTHWDREWYLPIGHFRVQLALLIDNLLDILDQDPGFRHFYLDGQTVLLEDYLAIRPDQADRLRRLVQDGRIQIGPWYTATDETLVSGESLVRNLLFGARDCASFGPRVRVGYLPDQFGHIAQLPQILRGFGIDAVVIGRGINRGENRNEFLWCSPDGSQVFGLFMNNWYSNARNIPDDPLEAARFLAHVADKAAQLSTTPHLLLMNGVDHMEAQPGLGKTLAAAAPLLDDELVHSSLGAAVAATRAAAGDRLERFCGELRQDLGGRLDAGTLSARMPLKLLNFAATMHLERVAEPLTALARLLGGPDLAALTELSWRTLLQTHPHDSICGCSIDTVARQMVSRYQEVADICTAVAQRAVQALAPALGYDDRPGEVLLYNPGVVPRRGVEIVSVDLPMAEPTRSPVRQRTDVERAGGRFQVTVEGPDGRAWDAQLIDIEETQRLVTAPLHLPRTQPVQRVRLALQACLPALGIARCRVSLSPLTTRAALGNLATSTRRLENEYLIVEVAADGTLWLTHKGSQVRIGPLHVVEDGGDAGDTYHYTPPQRDALVTAMRAQSVALVENGPLTAALRLSYVLHAPVGLSPDRHTRSRELAPLTIQTLVRVRRGVPYVTFDTEVTNNHRDHRLRVLFPSQAESEVITSGAQYAAVTRPIELPSHWVKAATTRPQWGWTDAAANGLGVAVFGRGLTEIEPLRTRAGVTLALTLLRCVGAVSRFTATPLVLQAPEAQCLGQSFFSYALYPHTGSWREARVPEVWESYATDVLTYQPRPAAETTGPNSAPSHCTQSWAPVTIDQPGFILSALKLPSPADCSQDPPFQVVVRGYSVAAGTMPVKITSAFALARAYLLDLAEAVQEALPVEGDTVTLQVKPGQIATVGLAVAAAAAGPAN